MIKKLSILHAIMICGWLFAFSPIYLGAEDYQYDKAGRLVEVKHDNGLKVTYTYDARGNLQSRSVYDPADVDRDLMKDSWEEQFFGNQDRTGSADFDSDGQTDYSEFVAGTDPTDPISFLKILNVVSINTGGISITWNSVEGVRYQLQSTSELRGKQWFNVGDSMMGSGETISLIVEGTSNEDIDSKYYRLLVIP